MELSPLGESLGEEGGFEKSTSNGRLDWNVGGNLEGDLLEDSCGAYGGSEIGSSNGMSDGNIYGKFQ